MKKPDRTLEEYKKEVESLESKILDTIDSQDVGIIIPAIVSVTQRVIGSLILDSENEKDLKERVDNVKGTIDILKRGIPRVEKLALISLKLEEVSDEETRS